MGAGAPRTVQWMLSLAAGSTVAELRDACGTDPGWICRTSLDVTGDTTAARILDAVFGTPLTILLIVVAALIVNRLARRAIKRVLRSLHSGAVQDRFSAVKRVTPDALLETAETSLRAEQRIEALASVLRSVTTGVIFAVAAFMVLDQLGINLGPLLAGAGIIGVAVGFGSQSLVKDFFSGTFILLEDQFGVGDIVDLGGTAVGTVEAVSLRTTRLRSVDGTVWHVPNGTIAQVGNMSQHWSRALLDIEVAYDTDVEHAREVIKRTADELHATDKRILEAPAVWGVQTLGPNGVAIRLVVKTRPSEQDPVARVLRERIKSAFEAEGIEIPFPQHTVWNRTVTESSSAP